MSVSRDAMYAAFELSPGDLAGYGAMADELTELGWEKLGHAFRWMSRRGVWPHKRENYSSPQGRIGRKVPAKFRWAWYAELGNPTSTLDTVNTRGAMPRAPHKNHALGPLLMIGDQKVFGSHQEAVMWLAKRLDNLQQVYDIEPPKRAEL